MLSRNFATGACASINRRLCSYVQPIQLVGISGKGGKKVTLVGPLMSFSTALKRVGPGGKAPTNPGIGGKNGPNLKWLYLWNRLTDFDASTFVWKLLMSTFTSPLDPYNRRNTAAGSCGQHWQLHCAPMKCVYAPNSTCSILEFIQHLFNTKQCCPQNLQKETARA